MRKLFFVLAASTSLAGCVGVASVHSIAKKLCDNEVVTLAALQLMYVQATLISDERKRELTLTAIRLAESAMDRCHAG